MPSWGEELVSKFSIVGEEEKSFCIYVEPSDREKAEWFIKVRDQIYYRVVDIICSCGHNTARLIHHQIIVLLIMNDLPISHYFHFIRCYRETWIFNHFSINCDLGFPDHGLDILSSADPGVGQIFVKSHPIHGIYTPRFHERIRRHLVEIQPVSR